MRSPEDDPGHEPGQGDIGGGRYAPAVGHDAQVVAAAIEYPGEKEEQPRRSNDTAQGSHQRVYGLPHGVQRAAGQHRLGDLLGGYTEEEHHENLVDQEVDRHRFAEDLGVLAEDMEVHHLFVGVDVDVRKDQPSDNTDYQRDGELLEDGYVMRAEQRKILSLKGPVSVPFIAP